jgi:hypothetical protein
MIMPRPSSDLGAHLNPSFVREASRRRESGFQLQSAQKSSTVRVCKFLVRFCLLVFLIYDSVLAQMGFFAFHLLGGVFSITLFQAPLNVSCHRHIVA